MTCASSTGSTGAYGALDRLEERIVLDVIQGDVRGIRDDGVLARHRRRGASGGTLERPDGGVQPRRELGDEHRCDAEPRPSLQRARGHRPLHVGLELVDLRRPADRQRLRRVRVRAAARRVRYLEVPPAEQALQDADRRQLPADHPAPGDGLRPEPAHAASLVVNTFVKDALGEKGFLSLHGGGWMWRPLVDVSDVARRARPLPSKRRCRARGGRSSTSCTTTTKSVNSLCSSPARTSG